MQFKPALLHHNAVSTSFVAPTNLRPDTLVHDCFFLLESPSAPAVKASPLNSIPHAATSATKKNKR